jgi:hypothetical protein
MPWFISNPKEYIPLKMDLLVIIIIIIIIIIKANQLGSFMKTNAQRNFLSFIIWHMNAVLPTNNVAANQNRYRWPIKKDVTGQSKSISYIQK